MSGGTLFLSALALLAAAVAGFFIVGRPGRGPVAGGEPAFSRLPARPAGGPELPQQGAAGVTAQTPVPAPSLAPALPIEPAPLIRDAFMNLQQAAEQIAAQGIRLPLPIPGSSSSRALPFFGAVTPGVAASGGGSPRGQPPSEEEIFNRIWPREYLGYLKGLERLEIRDGVIQATDPGSIIRFGAAPRISSEFDKEDPVANWAIPPGERHAAFATDQDVYDSYLTILERARVNDWITQEEFERFRHGIREVLPRLIERERENFRRGAPSSLTLPRDQRFSESTTVRTLVQSILDGIKYALLLAEPASAGWTTAPDCYKDDDPSSRALGFNAASFCCNCGIVWNCGKSGCVPVFVPDCGPNSSICDVPLGCLNAVCQDKPNAIWDPQTSICGCDGGGAGKSLTSPSSPDSSVLASNEGGEFTALDSVMADGIFISDQPLPGSVATLRIDDNLGIQAGSFTPGETQGIKDAVSDARSSLGGQYDSYPVEVLDNRTYQDLAQQHIETAVDPSGNRIFSADQAQKFAEHDGFFAFTAEDPSGARIYVNGDRLAQLPPGGISGAGPLDLSRSSVIQHEIGHSVGINTGAALTQEWADISTGGASIPSTGVGQFAGPVQNSVSTYGGLNVQEDFAETFVAYHQSRGDPTKITADPVKIDALQKRFDYLERSGAVTRPQPPPIPGG